MAALHADQLLIYHCKVTESFSDTLKMSNKLSFTEVNIRFKNVKEDHILKC